MNTHRRDGAGIVDAITLPFAVLPIVRGIRRQRAIQRRLNALRLREGVILPSFTREQLTPPAELLASHESEIARPSREEQAA